MGETEILFLSNFDQMMKAKMNRQKIVLGLCFIGVASFAETVLLSDRFDSSRVITDGSLIIDDIVPFGEVGSGDWDADPDSKWKIQDGAAVNAGGGTDAQNEGPLARIVDISSIVDPSMNKIHLTVNFATTSSFEKLFVHVRGYAAKNKFQGKRNLVSLSSTNGNCWESISSPFSAWSLSTGFQFDESDGGSAARGVLLTSDKTGDQSVVLTFDLSGHAIADISGYDYIGVFITRNAPKKGGTMAMIKDITLSAHSGSKTLGLISGADYTQGSANNRVAM